MFGRIAALPVGCSIGNTNTDDLLMERVVNVFKKWQLKERAIAVEKKVRLNAISPWEEVQVVHLLQKYLKKLRRD